MGYATFVSFVRVYCICVYYQFNSFNSTWFLHSFWEIELTKQMIDQENNINLGKIVFDDNNQERKSWACLGQTCSRSLIVFLSQLFVILLIIFGCFWRIHLTKTCDESTVWVGILCSAAGYIFLTKTMNKLIFTKNRVFFSLVGPSETGKSQLIYNWLKVGTFQPKFDKMYFFYQHSQPLYDVMQKEIENPEFVQGVNFEFNDSLKNSGPKHLLIIDDSCEEICNSKAFVEIANAGMHRGLSTIYIKHNLFHQSKLGRDVEFQNTHIVLFKSPRDVMQVTTLSTQLGLGSELVDWYRDATSVPFRHLLIDLSPRTDDRLRYCTNNGSVLSKFYLPERLKHLRTLDDEHTKSLYSPSVPIAFPQKQKSLFSVLPKRVYPASMRMHSKSTQRKLASQKTTSRGKVSRRRLATIAKKNKLEAKKKRSVARKRIATNSSHYTSRH